jgi:hypothetical protein
MGRTVVKYFVSILLICSFTCQSFAQQQGTNTASPVSNEWTSGPGIKKHIATIVYAGLAGFILGLSTLSFYGRPQDQLTNVTYGMAIGVVVGTVYVVGQAVHNPKDFYADPSNPATTYFELDEKQNGRFAMHPFPKPLGFSISF